MTDLLRGCIEIAKKAGAAVMDIYETDDFGVELKSDNSPLTRADIASNRIIEAGLKQLSDYPIISEEGSHSIEDSNKFWLVDPIDGTKEFINRNGEFTVNIGLIENGKPILGVVYAPAKNVMYFGSSKTGAYKQKDGGQAVKITAEYHGKIPTAVASRSHRNDATNEFLEKLGEHKIISMGSSLKLCLVAEGTAAVYPRFVPTSLWDTAAADAVLRAAGGSVNNIDGSLLKYDPAKIINPFFIAQVRNWPA
jgi:3'(2'), 5'-bisphosphate nucleotidase